MTGHILTAVAITVMLALNALYVAAEFATVGARKSRIQAEAQSGNRAAGKLFETVRDPVKLDNYVAACQVGITLSSLIAGFLGQERLTPLFEGFGGRVTAIIVTLLIVTSLQVILGELLPKTAALRYPERLAIATLRPMQISQALFKPLVAVFNGSAFAIMRGLGLDTEHSHAHVHSAEELAALFDESAAGGLIDSSERDMVAGVLNVQQRLVREIMTPRRRLVGVSGDVTIANALEELVGTPFTRFPVWSAEDQDDVIGLAHVRDLYVQAKLTPDTPVASIVRPVLDVAETLTVPAFWNRLDEADRHVAVVINEYGDVAGMVTLEDAIEEVFGEVRDEFDVDPDPVVVEGGRALVQGEVLLESLNQRFDLDLPTNDVDTIGGLIWHELSRAPAIGEVVALGNDGLSVTIEAMDGNAIERVSFDDPEAAR